MGCDIWTIAQRRNGGVWEDVTGGFAEGPTPFDWRSYGMFGFLAGVRNYSDIPPIAEPRGLPADFSEDDDAHNMGDHSFSWLSVDELVAFDYDQEIEDRRITVQVGPNAWSGAGLAEPGGGEKATYREFLGEGFFSDLAQLRRLGAERIVFGFDS